MTLRTRVLGSMALLAGASLFLLGCNRQETARAAGPQMPAPIVTIAPAIARDVPTYLDEIGRTGAFESVTVTPQLSGRITERQFQDGADLRKDQLLFVIDPRPFKAQLDAAQAQLAQAKAALDLANTQLKMYASISDSRAVSALDFETKKNSVSVDEAQVQAAQAAVENAQLNLDYCYVRSPIDGRAGARLVDVGNVVQANTTGLLSVQRLNPIYADFTVTERDLTEVRRQMAQGALRVMARVPAALPTGGRMGSLTFLDNAVQNQTGTVNLRSTIPNADSHFWPCQFVTVTLILRTEKGAVLIPNEAAQISQQGSFVYIVKSDDTAELRQVTLGLRQGDDVVVANGVAAGERVVVTGQLTVTPGVKIRVQPTPPGTPAGAGGQGPSSGGGKS